MGNCHYVYPNRLGLFNIHDKKLVYIEKSIHLRGEVSAAISGKLINKTRAMAKQAGKDEMKQMMVNLDIEAVEVLGKYNAEQLRNNK